MTLTSTLRPLSDRVIVTVLEEEEVTVAGIIIPENAQEKSTRGLVIAVGPGSRDQDGNYMPLDVEAGDEIVFSKYGGTTITLEREDYLILRESDLLAVVQE